MHRVFNSLPNHCFFGQASESPIAVEDDGTQGYYLVHRWNVPIDFTDKYNTDVTLGTIVAEDFVQTEINSSTADSFYCDHSWATETSIDANVYFSGYVS